MDFLEIYDRYYERVRKFILASIRNESVADDLLQETFTRVQMNINQVRDSIKISSWIFRVAYNLCQDHFRNLKKPSSTAGELDEEMYLPQETSVQKELEQQEMGQCVQAQLNLLPESLRSVLILFDVMEFSQQEVADILGLTVENVKVRLHRARKKMKKILEEKCTFEVDERNVLTCEPIPLPSVPSPRRGEKVKGRGHKAE